MSLYLFDGIPGSGKSYYTTFQVIDALRSGKKVFTNCHSLDKKRISWYLHKQTGRHPKEFFDNLIFIRNKELSDMVKSKGRFTEFRTHHLRNAVILLDEVMLEYFSRNFQKFPEELVYFFSQHRKYGCDVWLVSQDNDKLDTVIREMAECQINILNLSRTGMFGVRFPIPLFYVRWVLKTGELFKKEWVFPERKVYGFYNTRMIFKNPMIDVPDDEEVYRFGVRNEYQFSDKKVVTEYFLEDPIESWRWSRAGYMVRVPHRPRVNVMSAVPAGADLPEAEPGPAGTEGDSLTPPGALDLSAHFSIT